MLKQHSFSENLPSGIILVTTTLILKCTLVSICFVFLQIPHICEKMWTECYEIRHREIWAWQTSRGHCGITGTACWVPSTSSIAHLMLLSSRFVISSEIKAQLLPPLSALLHTSKSNELNARKVAERLALFLSSVLIWVLSAPRAQAGKHWGGHLTQNRMIPSTW